MASAAISLLQRSKSIYKTTNDANIFRRSDSSQTYTRKSWHKSPPCPQPCNPIMACKGFWEISLLWQQVCGGLRKNGAARCFSEE